MVVTGQTGNVGIFGSGGNFYPSTTLHVGGSLLTTSWTGINFSAASNVTPTVPLEVSGTVSATNIKTAGTMTVGMYNSAPVACSTSYTGMVAMSNTLKDLCLCDGTSWVAVGRGGTACTW
jgi:hypothetical protein